MPKLEKKKEEAIKKCAQIITKEEFDDSPVGIAQEHYYSGA